MTPLVMVSSLTAFLITSSVLSKFGSKIDEKDARIKQIKGNTERKTEKKKMSLKEVLELLNKNSQDNKINRSKPAGKNVQLQQMLSMMDLPISESQFYLIRLGSGILIGLISYLIGSKLIPSMGLLIGLAGLILGILIPQKILDSAVKKKKEQYRDSLPDIMDLLIVSLEAGLGFDAALLRLHEKDKSPLMEELIKAENDIQHGMTKKDSYTNMINRCQVKEVTSFLNALLQAEQMGISIKTVLKNQAENLREDRRQRAEEKALKAPVKMLIPMVMFIFPVIFIILLGPAAMNVIEAFS